MRWYKTVAHEPLFIEEQCLARYIALEENRKTVLVTQNRIAKVASSDSYIL